MKAVILTISDKGSRGERVDTSGPALKQWLEEHGVSTVALEILPDEEAQIADRLMHWTALVSPHLLLTTGGTGVSPRDVTPEATQRVVDRLIPGLAELMRLRSLQITPRAALSRAVAGIRQGTLILNLPGSPKGALENLEAVWPTLPHAVAKIRGDQSDCATS
ncbi:MogA/MoaB family molybdenum cofactor biosynthesis protein [Desulfuromonas sp. KJ2020]|uniref:MogA/MoaB family molybdenum cofactor biosynthesis protein n=1 Tax=Desulfuromonas sp. KJ2020 TaxID=2919173 RepID=UPI0020A77550|nr:MogA/MoaB family molybdenum cofactor biosynthesis protein [Desulfuromonas sp. KJ2020]MCP3178295.1 MogA/MoaB family molybdenum cofactor biosynthesis protein [Desulfuromonas sp. KJ2020]